MRKLTEKQSGLLAAVWENPGLNTHQLAEKLGHRQSYETPLCDRLFTLERMGLVRHEPGEKHGFVVARHWFPVE